MRREVTSEATNETHLISQKHFLVLCCNEDGVKENDALNFKGVCVQSGPLRSDSSVSNGSSSCFYND